VDAHFFELAGDAHLLLPRHRGARTLFAVAQGGIENYQMFLCHRHLQGNRNASQLCRAVLPPS
ncbi:MAG: hypothetical protein AAB319_09445, partial [Pseudomonadota bacterium]